MSREWKPGDVAMVTWRGREVQATFYNTGSERGWYHGDGLASEHYIGTVRDIPARPLVVIDPEDREQVKRLWRLNAAEYDSKRNPQPEEISNLQAALREFASPTPSEPTDPTVRVTDRRENVWRLLADGDWVCTSGPDIGEYLVWSRLAAERGPLSTESAS